MKTVDRLGRVQAEIAALREEEKQLKGELFDGAELDGDLFKACIVEAERTTTDWKKIAIDLGASLQKIRANSKTALVTSIKVTARSTAARRAA